MLSPWSLLMLLVILELHSGHAYNRTERDQECDEDEYGHKGKCCRTCPAGTHVFSHCMENHARGVCEPCTPGKYFTAGPSGMEQCLACSHCKDDKVMVQECTPNTDRTCECKPGYYCSHDEPCEMCSQCSRCGESQRLKKACTSTTNTVCEEISAPESTSTNTSVKISQTVPMPTESFNDVTGLKAGPTDPPDPSPGSKFYIYLTVGLTLVALIIIIIFLVYGYHKRKDKRKPEDITENNSENTSLDDIENGGKDPEEDNPPQEDQRLIAHKSKKVENISYQRAETDVLGAQREAGENIVPESLEDDVENEESPQLRAQCQECLEPQPCEKQWSRFFYIVIDNVKPSRILELVRRLHLNNSAIYHILQNNTNDCKEQNYELFNEWRRQRGKRASMKAVINELKDMDLGGCCENIINNVKAEKIPLN